MTDTITLDPLCQRMIEDMAARKLGPDGCSAVWHLPAQASESPRGAGSRTPARARGTSLFAGVREPAHERTFCRRNWQITINPEPSSDPHHHRL